MQMILTSPHYGGSFPSIRVTVSDDGTFEAQDNYCTRTLRYSGSIYQFVNRHLAHGWQLRNDDMRSVILADPMPTFMLGTPEHWRYPTA
jgi:hypothetical protein